MCVSVSMSFQLSFLSHSYRRSLEYFALSSLSTFCTPLERLLEDHQSKVVTLPPALPEGRPRGVPDLGDGHPHPALLQVMGAHYRVPPAIAVVTRHFPDLMGKYFFNSS